MARIKKEKDQDEGEWGRKRCYREEDTHTNERLAQKIDRSTEYTVCLIFRINLSDTNTAQIIWSFDGGNGSSVWPRLSKWFGERCKMHRYVTIWLNNGPSSFQAWKKEMSIHWIISIRHMRMYVWSHPDITSKKRWPFSDDVTVFIRRT